MEKTFAMISLGCAKNLVNSEQMLYLLSEAGYTLVPEADGADLAVVNTCGFIDAAKSEAIDNILEMAELKKAGRLGGLIVTGCLSERYKDSILSELPEIDAVLGVGSFGDIVAAADAVMAGEHLSRFASNSAPVDEIARVVSTGPSWAYLRIAEGCDNFCAFCAIPYIRGRYRSRPMDCRARRQRADRHRAGYHPLRHRPVRQAQSGSAVPRAWADRGRRVDQASLSLSRPVRRRADRRDRLKRKDRQISRHPDPAHQRRDPKAHEPPRNGKRDPRPFPHAARADPRACAAHESDRRIARRGRGRV